MLAKLVPIVALSLAIPLAIALGLILSQRPVSMAGSGGLDFAHSLQADLDGLPNTVAVSMRDGHALQVRRYAGPDAAPLVVLVHGSGWHGMQFRGLAQALQTHASVIVPDLRGHGAAPGRRGDIDYIGQFEDDLADLITATRAPGQKVLMAGHSSGGGLVVRMAGGRHAALMDGAVLMAPFLQHDAPTTRPSSGGWAHVLVRRIAGIAMLNMARIRALNHLTIIQFDMPRAVLDGPLGHTATRAYSYRLNTSFAPRRAYLEDVAGLPRFALMVGAEDEAFVASKFAPLMGDVTGKGRYVVVPGHSHLSIVDAPETLAEMKELLDAL